MMTVSAHNQKCRLLALAAASLLMGISNAPAQDTSYGQRLFHEKADCQFCHGINGDGHGDPRSPGKASDLHKTSLTRDQLVEVIACGRPGSEMPHFDKYAYEDRVVTARLPQTSAKTCPLIPIRRR
jgi:mono/diheme cytochrome c family protein